MLRVLQYLENRNLINGYENSVNAKKLEKFLEIKIIVEERLEKERLEKERLDKERLEKERLEKERLEKERLEKKRREKQNFREQTLYPDIAWIVITLGTLWWLLP